MLSVRARTSARAVPEARGEGTDAPRIARFGKCTHEPKPEAMFASARRGGAARHWGGEAEAEQRCSAISPRDRNYILDRHVTFRRACT